MEIVLLPVAKFNRIMREIMLGSDEAELYIKNIVDKIKKEIKDDEYNEAIDSFSNNDSRDSDTFDVDDFLADALNDDGLDEDDLDDDSFNFDELLK